LSIKNRGQLTIDDFELADLSLVDYQSHAAIKAKMAV
jgi:thymidylate synthase